MAGAGAGGTPPLRLKDLLELDCDSCSAAGFRCYPRRLLGESSSSSATAMRRLLDSPPSLRRRPSKKLPHLSRSLSRRLLSRGGLFRLRQDDEDDDACGAGAAPSGVVGSESVASSSSSSETTTTSDNSSGGRGSRCESDSDFSTATTSSSTSDSMDAAAVNGTTGDEHEAMKRSGSEPDDKEEQLSPVAVMDFPDDDDDESDGERGVCSPSFSLVRLQRRKMLRQQHKFRRFGSTEELGPVDLETLLAATSDSETDDIVEEPGPVDLETLMAATASDSDTDDVADDVQRRIGDAAAVAPPRPSWNNCHGSGVVYSETHGHGLLELLMGAASACVDHVSERLLFDFFVEMKRRRGSMEHSGAEWLLPREAERLGDGEVFVAAARRWLDGVESERWGLNDVLRGGEAIMSEMERPQRWMQVGKEELEVGIVVARMLADQLVDEMVWDLLV